MNRTISFLFFKYLSNLLYLIGISIVIPFVINFSVPDRVLFVNMPKALLIIIAIIFVAAGFIGVYFRKGELGKAFSSLGFLTLIPALVSVYILIFGDKLLVNLAERLKLTTFVDFSLRNVPSVWILTASYFVLATVWFWLGRKFR